MKPEYIIKKTAVILTAAALFICPFGGTDISAAKSTKKNGMEKPVIKSGSCTDSSISLKLKKKIKKATGYQVAYRKKGTTSQKKKLIYKKGKTISLSNLTAATRYQFRVRSFRIKSGKKIYSKWSTWKTFLLKNKDTFTISRNSKTKDQNAKPASDTSENNKENQDLRLGKDGSYFYFPTTFSDYRYVEDNMTYNQQIEFWGKVLSGEITDASDYIKKSAPGAIAYFTAENTQPGTGVKARADAEVALLRSADTSTLGLMEQNILLEIESDECIDKWINTYITDAMTPFEILEQITNYVKRFKYGSTSDESLKTIYDQRYSYLSGVNLYLYVLPPKEEGIVDPVIYGGVCGTGSDWSRRILQKLGFHAYVHSAGIDYFYNKVDKVNYGQASGHMDNFVWIDGKRYLLDATPGNGGFYFEWESSCSDYTGYEDNETYQIYQEFDRGDFHRDTGLPYVNLIDDTTRLNQKLEWVFYHRYE